MKENSFDIPVLLVKFNRPTCTAQVLEKIVQLKPKKLYVFSDAARAGKKDELSAVNQCRSLFNSEHITWDCEIKTWFADANIGCGRAVSSAISWMFETEECGIILEDDCLPHLSFFEYCDTMLKKYADNPEVMHIAGTRWNDEFKKVDDNYFFSRIGHVWGWATWKRAWKLFDYNMSTWNRANDRKTIYKQLNSVIQTQFWIDNFQRMFDKGMNNKNVWDYQWQYAMFMHKGLSVVPYANLISNIGIEGTHASLDNKDQGVFNRQTIRWNQDAKLVNQVKANHDYDNYHIVNFFMKANNPVIKLKWFIKACLAS